MNAPHGCIEWLDSRTCYELRTYGYSPVLRHKEDSSEGMYMQVDEYGDCDCDCHALAEDSDE